MSSFRRWAATLPFCVALVMPVTLAAFDHDRDDRDHRYYDQEHKDYHNWNAGEQRYWREYWTSQHHPYIEWERANEKQRQDYWRWRHEHEHHDHDDRH